MRKQSELFGWLAENGYTVAKFARKLGITTRYLYHIDQGNFIPSKRLSYRIFRITEGAVKLIYNEYETIAVKTEMTAQVAGEFEEQEKNKPIRARKKNVKH